MKLNFWQWLGIIIVVIALIFIIRREAGERGGADRSPGTATDVSTEPAVEPPTTAEAVGAAPTAPPTTLPAAP